MVEKGTISIGSCKIPSVVKLQKEMTTTLCIWLYSVIACEQKHKIMYVVRIVCVGIRTSSPVTCLESLSSQVAVMLFLRWALFSFFYCMFLWKRLRMNEMPSLMCRSPPESLSYIWINGVKWSFYLPKRCAALNITSPDFLRPNMEVLLRSNLSNQVKKKVLYGLFFMSQLWRCISL